MRDSTLVLYSLTFFIMFNALYQSVFANAGTSVNSTCADFVSVDAITGTARVQFKNGALYNYTNVSRRAIIKFMIDDARSLGKFINNVLTQSRVKCASV